MRTVPIQSSNEIDARVSEIIENVRLRGDEALKEYTRAFDGADIADFAVSRTEIDEAWEAVGDKLRTLLTRAAQNIRDFHAHQKREGFVVSEKPGITLGQRVIPLKRAGIYVPGGTASYPSTVLMNGIPPAIAGVGQVVMVTPPGKDGKIAPAILAAARAAGVDTIFKAGGAQAIAALAYGTKSIPRVDKIVGPGNAYVATAKRKVYGLVDIDMVAGPSEILIIAEGDTNVDRVAADLLSQAEHDALSSAILITTSESLANAVRDRVEARLDGLLRRDIARRSIDGNGRIIIVESLDEAFEIANEIAPEHLEICLEEPFNYLGRVRNAGSVFLGDNAPEALGDYWAGLNHTLPTSGTARFSSPLSVDDFVKKSQFVYYSRDALGEAADDIIAFAETEGLTGHAQSVAARFGGNV
ncbi:MAG: histidinol dehydrogenase [Clostridia bacterium]|nr:histidinol dehydrogenase [Clostridia bacterium]